MKMETSYFFGPLSRRSGYPKKTDGTNYSYGYFREKFQGQIAEDCKGKCVYCDSHEEEIGGRDAMQLDHFRPYSKEQFVHLEDDPFNLHYACARCNLLKSDHWPCTEQGLCHSGTVGFIDPFGEIRSDYFDVQEDGVIIPKQDPAQYLIRLLALDRPYLKRLREKRILKAKLQLIVKEELPRLEAVKNGEGDMTKEEAIDCAWKMAKLVELLQLLRE